MNNYLNSMMGDINLTVTRKSRADPETLIGLVRNWYDLPEFWRGMREIKVGESGILRVRFAFPGTARMSYIWDPLALAITENYLDGPFTGFKRVEFLPDANGTTLRATWNIKLSLPLIPLAPFIKGHFREGTENALKRLSEKAEMMIKPRIIGKK
ncbi:MAG: SRPBCC family protein [Thermoplasmataceae archaeon]